MISKNQDIDFIDLFAMYALNAGPNLLFSQINAGVKTVGLLLPDK